MSTGQQTIRRSRMSVLRDRAPVFVPLLVLALLICHGALGSVGDPALKPITSGPIHHSPVEAGGSGSGGGHPIEHPPAHGYYVVAFLTVLVGAFLRLISKGAIPTRRITLPFLQTRHNFTSPILYPGPRLTPNLLQVLRL